MSVSQTTYIYSEKLAGRLAGWQQLGKSIEVGELDRRQQLGRSLSAFVKLPTYLPASPTYVLCSFKMGKGGRSWVVRQATGKDKKKYLSPFLPADS